MSSPSPLDLKLHLKLRETLSTISRSSFLDVWKHAPKNGKIECFMRFLKLRFGAGKISSNEFIQYGFGTSSLSFEEQKRFAGKRAQQAFNLIYNDKTWYAATKHKLLFETVMKGADIPCTETVAVYDRKGRGVADIVLKDDDELTGFLKNESNFPIFAKPTTGLLSIGAFRIDQVTKNDLLINGTHKMPIAHVHEYMKGISKKGYLFQRVLDPHVDMVKLTKDAIASCRFLIFNLDDKAIIHSCCLKLPAEGEVADNFWRTGSILCHVDIESGEITRASLKQENNVSLICEESDLYHKIIGFKLPDFNDAKSIVVKAARNFSGIKVQSWDVALTSNGPIVLEVNYGGDLNLAQLASAKGVMEKEYCNLLRQSGYLGKLPK